MKRRTRSQTIARPGFLAFCVALAALGQTPPPVSSYNGVTSAGQTPGSPAGVYALSDIESVNLANGYLNLNIPFGTVPSRGGSKIVLAMPIEMPKWNVVGNPYCPSGDSCPQNPFNYTYVITSTDWNSFPKGMGHASLVYRGAGRYCTSLYGVDGWGQALSRLTFTEPDGTEHELVDTATNAQIKDQPGVNLPRFNRGTTFAALDGSHATFVAGGDWSGGVLDPPGCSTPTGTGMTGIVTTRDGTQYFFELGRATEIVDRNGNSFTFDNDPNDYYATTIHDALGRSTNITHQYTSGSTRETLTVASPSFANPAVVTLDDYANCLKPGITAKTYQELFPNALPSYIWGNPTGTPTVRVICEIALPNSSQGTSTGRYQFLYNAYGEVARVILPSGGAFEYDYALAQAIGSGQGDAQTSPYRYTLRRRMTERRVYSDAAATNLVQRVTYGWDITDTSAWIVDGDVTVNYYDAGETLLSQSRHLSYAHNPPENGLQYNTWLAGHEYQTELHNGDGSLIRTAISAFDQRPCNAGENCWYTPPLNDPGTPAHDPRLISQTTYLNDAGGTAEVLGSEFVYDQYNNRTWVKEHALGQGSWGGIARQTETVYATDADHLARNLVSLPTRVTLWDATGAVKLSETIYEYDVYTSPRQPLDSTCSSSVERDATVSSSRGNATAITSWLKHPITGVERTLNPHVYVYDVQGNVVRSVDPRGVRQDVGYSEAEGHCSLPVTFKSYPNLNDTGTAFTSGLHYNVNVAKPTSASDINSATTSFDYSDSLARISMVTRPDGGRTQFAYDDTPGAMSVLTRADQNGGDFAIQSRIYYDGLGREWIRQVSEGDYVLCMMTRYDRKGRKSGVSNPIRQAGGTCSASEASYTNWTTTLYDGADRPTQITAPGGAVTVTKYQGSKTFAKDSSGRNRVSQTDGLGRLVTVYENDKTWPGESGFAAEPTYTTSYTYDLLDNLTGVNQSGQTRTFYYDSLKRLVRSTQPETNQLATDYEYDDSGNLTSKTDPRGVVTTYSDYDGLNRVKGKSYSNDPANTSAVAYCYDGNATGCGNAGAPTGSKLGHLTYLGNGESRTEYLEFSNRGFIKRSRQTVGANPPYDFSYTYNRAGAMTSESYPSGRVVTTGYDAAGRANSVQSGSTTYASIPAAPSGYWENGAIHTLNYGNSLTETTTVNQRFQPTNVAIGTLLSIGLDYGLEASNNGNVQSQTITAGSVTFKQCYNVYDAVNRLKRVDEGSVCGGTTAGWWAQFDYDAWGNRAVSASFPLHQTTPTAVGQYDTATNQIKLKPDGGAMPTDAYDAAGNLKNHPLMGVISYDAENRMVGMGTTSMAYDGEGRRVKKATASGTVVYVYDVQGQLAAEYTTGTPPAALCQTCYLTADHLGSTRLVTDEGGAVKQRRDYHPFGEEILASATFGGRQAVLDNGVPTYNAANGPVQEFTAKERDVETGLDYFGARYFSGAQGRFVSPDEFWKDSHVGDPQSWNKYAYVRNNPLRYIDPSGEKADVTTTCTTNQQNQTTCQVNVQASIAVYATPGSNLTQQQMNAAAATIQNSIQGAWTGQFQQDGVTYNVSTTVNVQVAGSEAAAMQSGAQNVLGLNNGNASATADSYVNPRPLLGGPDTGVWNINNLGNGVAAHEFTHLLGVDDKSGLVLSNTNLLNNPAIPHQATTSDFRWGVQEAVSNVNSRLHAPPYLHARFGEVVPNPYARKSFTDRTTPRAPFFWWK